MTLTTQAVTVVVGTLLPILVGLLTKLHASPKLKSMLLFTLAAAAGLIVNATVDDGSAVISRESFIIAAIAWVQGMASYLGFWKPNGISPAINYATRNIGLGSSTPAQGPDVHIV